MAGLRVLILAAAFACVTAGIVTPRPNNCLATEFECRNRECVPVAHLCDGVPNCSDHSDEEKCDYSSAHCADDTWFKCKTPDDGKLRCVNPSYVCDGDLDCHDGSDEAVCQITTGMPTSSLLPDMTCKDNEFQCKNGLCIPEIMTCDDVSECIDGSDEDPEMCRNRDCRSDEFRCVKDNKCIPKRWLCDGQIECSDGSDELNCHNSAVVPSICSNDAFDCNDNKTCLPLDKVCDGVSDCPNGTDESDDCEVSCTKLNCQSACRKSPNGQGTCTCPQGYQLGQDQLSCEDVDECQTFGQCSQRCINHPGNFECRCEEGYEMVDKVCRARGIKSPMLLFAGKSEVVGLDLKTHTSFVVTRDSKWVSTAIGIAYDARDDRVFWSALSKDKSQIVSSGRDGTFKKVVVDGLVMPESLAIDHVARNIYYSEPAKEYMGVCSLDGQWCAKLIVTNIEHPREIALYTPAGLLFYTDWGLIPKIVRAGMDGKMAQTIVSEDLHWPNGIAVDSTIKRIFWSDAKHDRLESALFDGSDRKRIDVTVIKHPFSLAVFEDRLYWSDWEYKQIQSCNKYTGKNRASLFNDTKIEPFGIHIYHPALEHIGQVNPCSDAPCSHLCLLAYGGRTFTCHCPHNMTLSADPHTCQPIPHPTTEAPKTTDFSWEPVNSAVETAQYNQRLRLGLGIGLFMFLIVLVFFGICYFSYRRNKDQPSPVLRFKNPAFGYDENESEDLDIFVENSPSKPGSKGSDLTRNLDGGKWPLIESRNSQSEDSEEKRSKFPSWRPNSNTRYYKL